MGKNHVPTLIGLASVLVLNSACIHRPSFAQSTPSPMRSVSSVVIPVAVEYPKDIINVDWDRSSPKYDIGVCKMWVSVHVKSLTPQWPSGETPSDTLRLALAYDIAFNATPLMSGATCTGSTASPTVLLDVSLSWVLTSTTARLSPKLSVVIPEELREAWKAEPFPALKKHIDKELTEQIGAVFSGFVIQKPIGKTFSNSVSFDGTRATASAKLIDICASSPKFNNQKILGNVAVDLVVDLAVDGETQPAGHERDPAPTRPCNPDRLDSELNVSFGVPLSKIETRLRDAMVGKTIEGPPPLGPIEVADVVLGDGGANGVLVGFRLRRPLCTWVMVRSGFAIDATDPNKRVLRLQGAVVEPTDALTTVALALFQDKVEAWLREQAVLDLQSIESDVRRVVVAQLILAGVQDADALVSAVALQKLETANSTLRGMIRVTAGVSQGSVLPSSR